MSPSHTDTHPVAGFSSEYRTQMALSPPSRMRLNSPKPQAAQDAPSLMCRHVRTHARICTSWLGTGSVHPCNQVPGRHPNAISGRRPRAALATDPGWQQKHKPQGGQTKHPPASLTPGPPHQRQVPPSRLEFSAQSLGLGGSVRMQEWHVGERKEKSLGEGSRV